MYVHRKISSLLVALAIALTLGTVASADFSLQVTEIWPGNEPGSNLTADWFELTNVGSMAYNASTDGDLYYDDNSFDAAVADLINGVSSIGAGESVIFVVGDATDVTNWTTVWQPVVANLPQVGYTDGSGLGGGGDAVGIFLDAGFDGVDAGDLIETQAYPEADPFGGQSFDVRLGAFSVDGVGGAVSTLVLNDVGQAAVGSPGTVPVPEPSTATLILIGMSAALMRRRK